MARRLAAITCCVVAACGGDPDPIPPKDAGFVHFDGGTKFDSGQRDAAPTDAIEVLDAEETDAETRDASIDLGVDAGGMDAAIDGGPIDGGAIDAGFDGGPVVEAPAIYPTDRTLSPITPWVVANLQSILRRGMGDTRVFAKVGASATASTNFLNCFGGPFVDLDGRDALAPAIDWFLAGDAAGTNPFERTSLTAVAGWHAGRAITGDPSPLTQEIAAIDPSLAVVMYGTNDINIVDIDTYAANMLTLTDQLIAGGIVPLLTSVMPRDDDAAADADVPRYNAVVRAIAEIRQIPFIDFHRELMALPDHGLGPDDIHPSVYQTTAGARACVFDADGLRFGYDIRNLITLESLDRVRRALFLDEPPPDGPETRALRGSGTHADPYVIDRLPFADLRSTTAGERQFSKYDGCAATQDESGPEIVYRLELGRAAKVRAYVLDRGTVDVDIHLLDSRLATAGCVTRAHTVVSQDLTDASYHLVLDTFVSGGTEHGGEYMLVVLEE